MEKDVLSFYNYAVLIDVPKEVRLERIKQRSFCRNSVVEFYREEICTSRKKHFTIK